MANAQAMIIQPTVAAVTVDLLALHLKHRLPFPAEWAGRIGRADEGCHAKRQKETLWQVHRTLNLATYPIRSCCQNDRLWLVSPVRTVHLCVPRNSPSHLSDQLHPSKGNTRLIKAKQT